MMKSKRNFKEFIQKGNKRLIKNYFISYIFIFMFPFLVLSGILYWSFTKNIKEQAETNNRSNLNQIHTLLDNQFHSLSRLGNQISINPHLTNFMLEHPFYNQEGRNQLAQYSNNNPLIENAFVYYKASNNFYSAAGLYSYSAFEKKLSTLKVGQDDLSKFLKTTTNQLAVYPVQSDPQRFQLAYYVPLKNISSENYGTAIFFLKNQELEKLLKNGTENKMDSIFLFDQQNQMILSSNKEINIKKFDQQLENSSIKKLTDKNIDYAVATTFVANDQLKLVSLMDYSIYTQQASNLIWILVVVLIFVLLLGIGLSFYLSYRQYRPFEHLDKSFKKLSLGQYPEEEILFMEQSKFSTKAISFFEDHYTLQKELNEQHEVVRTLFLYHLLEGKTGTVQELQKKMYDFGLPFDNGTYTVCIVQPYLSINTQKNEPINSSILTSLPINIEGMSIETLQLPFTNFWICILFLPTEKQNSHTSKIYKQFENQMNDVYNDDCRFFYGRSYPNALHISQSYKEACAAQEYGLFHPENKIVYYNEISISNENFSLAFQHQKLAKLRQSLDDGKIDDALQAVDSLFDDERLKKVSVNIFKCYYYDMINLILKIALNLDIKLPEDAVQQIINTNSLVDAKQKIKEIVSLICMEINERKKAKQSEQDNQIIQYIKENFASLDFSLEATAKMFGLTSPYLSRLIKQEIGLTASKYVQQLRLEKIKKELIETDEPIKAIIVNAGYYDISNYSRKFKQLVGVTPGQYRTLNKKQEGNDPHEDFSK